MFYQSCFSNREKNKQLLNNLKQLHTPKQLNHLKQQSRCLNLIKGNGFEAL